MESPIKKDTKYLKNVDKNTLHFENLKRYSLVCNFFLL